MNSLIYPFAQKLLQSMDPEVAHELTIKALSAGLGPCPNKQTGLETEFAGLNLPNPIGIAAGFDKNAKVPDALLRAGFGFVECGTVTPLAQSGNPKPRLFRLKEDEAIINAMGFNNYGLDYFCANLRRHSKRGGIIGANIGANKDSADRINDYVTGLVRVWQYATYITINISSPNTKGLRGLQDKSALQELLGRINVARLELVQKIGHRPIFLKVAPDLDDLGIAQISEEILAAKLDGIIVSNTTLSRPETLRSKYKSSTGGLSGRPLFEISTQKLSDFRKSLGKDFPIIGVGGISSGDDAIKKFEAGANAIQLYSAFVYQGPKLLKEIQSAIQEYRGLSAR